MENNLENALKHIADSGIGGEIRHESKGHYTFNFDPEKIAASFVAYANSVRQRVVVPSEEEIIARFPTDGPVSSGIGDDYTESDLNGYGVNGINWILSELRRLNPTMTFTELNHEK